MASTATESLDRQIETLREQVSSTEAQLRRLRQELQRVETVKATHQLRSSSESEHTLHVQSSSLSSEEYQRYGRQLIMPEIGLQGQLRLKKAKVLIVGAGGLGCPAAAYLAGAGVGCIGLVDGDVVEASNLHRQIAHSTFRVGVQKVDSAVQYLQELNPLVHYIPHPNHLTPQDALQIMDPYDIVLDCTDHPTSRYLISDACVLLGKPLVSASALRTEGQLMVLNNPPAPAGEEDSLGGPCYRCIFPKPPPAQSVISCGEGGILGPVVGVMGVLQALEAIKIITTPPQPATEAVKPTLLLFSAYSSPPFRTVRLRSRRKDCASCSVTRSVTRESLTSGSMDYVAFCGVTNPVSILADDERIDPKQLGTSKATIIDVRDATQFELCSLPNSINIPWSEFSSRVKSLDHEHAEWTKSHAVVVVCRLGNDSQMAVEMMKASGHVQGPIVDMRGGLRAWKQDVDPTWPDY